MLSGGTSSNVIPDWHAPRPRHRQQSPALAGAALCCMAALGTLFGVVLSGICSTRMQSLMLSKIWSSAAPEPAAVAGKVPRLALERLRIESSRERRAAAVGRETPNAVVGRRATHTTSGFHGVRRWSGVLCTRRRAAKS